MSIIPLLSGDGLLVDTLTGEVLTPNQISDREEAPSGSDADDSAPEIERVADEEAMSHFAVRTRSGSSDPRLMRSLYEEVRRLDRQHSIGSGLSPQERAAMAGPDTTLAWDSS